MSAPELTPELTTLFESYVRLLLEHYSFEEGSMGQKEYPLKERQRLTYHFISALIASGFPKSSPFLLKAYDWLKNSREDYNEPFNDDDYLVLPKIEASIEMGFHEDDFCKKAISLLTERQKQPAFFEIPGQGPKPFHSVWAARILLLHPDREKYKNIVDAVLDQFSASTNIMRSREISLTFSMCVASRGADFITSGDGQKMLKALEQNQDQGLHDFPSTHRELIQQLKAKGLSLDLVAGLQNEIYPALVSTAYIVANLSSAAKTNERVNNLVKSSCKALVSILATDPGSVNSVFVSEYQQIMLMTRSIVAFSSVADYDVSKMILPGILLKLVESEKKQKEIRREKDRNLLTDVLRKYIKISWDESDYKTLGGGFSGANLIRIKPKITFPNLEVEAGKSATIHLPVIIKYGARVDLQRERANFEKITPEHRSYFAAIPDKPYNTVVDGEPYEYLLIRDLEDYETLRSFLPTISPEVFAFFQERLFDFLSVVYQMPTIETTQSGFTRNKYISPIFNSLGLIDTLKNKVSRYTEEDTEIYEDLQSVIKMVSKFDRFPFSVMHGDLNMRNIMVKGDPRGESEFRFKLIDIDKFTRSGDIAYDIGEFVVDFCSWRDRFDKKAVFWSLGDSCQEYFARFAVTKKDNNFLARYRLAMARSAMKLAEIKCREVTDRSAQDPLGQEVITGLLDSIEPTLVSARTRIKESLQLLS